MDPVECGALVSGGPRPCELLGVVPEPSATYVITPTLFLGPGPMTNLVLTPAVSVANAVRVIESGGSALLPAGGWDLAEGVLHRFGLDDARIHELFFFGLTGRFPAPWSPSA